MQSLKDSFKTGDKIMGCQQEDQFQKYSEGIYAGTIISIEVIEKKDGDTVYYRGVEAYQIEPMPGTSIFCVEASGVEPFNDEKWKRLKELNDKKVVADKEFFGFVYGKGGLHSGRDDG